jgi:hypothetical protein
MRRLFVDCEHTLVTFNHVFDVKNQEAWEPNWEVVAAIERWQAQGLGDVVVWSDRGVEDATKWTRRILPHLAGITHLTKDRTLLNDGDVMIDDSMAALKGTRYSPQQSFMVAAPLH